MNTKTLKDFLENYNGYELSKVIGDLNFSADDFLKLEAMIRDITLRLNGAREYRLKYCKDDTLRNRKSSSKQSQKKVITSKKKEQNEIVKSNSTKTILETISSSANNKY